MDAAVLHLPVHLALALAGAALAVRGVVLAHLGCRLRRGRAEAAGDGACNVQELGMQRALASVRHRRAVAQVV